MEFTDGDGLLEGMRAYRIPCILAAAVDLDVFGALDETPASAENLASRLDSDPRAMTILLDALAAIGLLVKAVGSHGSYAVPPRMRDFLLDESPRSVAAMLRHQANCLRRWAELPRLVKTGERPDSRPSLRGVEADRGSFIEAMHVISRPIARPLIEEVRPPSFRCVLDVGGGPATWTLAWLAAEPEARVILFDLPDAIPIARRHLESHGVADRVRLVSGDFNCDELPRGADVAWLSAIIHQNSPSENRSLYGRVARALPPDGVLIIRDVVMDDSRTAPLEGALFAVNMLVATEGGNTYTLSAIREDLEASGFQDVRLVRKDPGMHSVVSARRSATQVPRAE